MTGIGSSCELNAKCIVITGAASGIGRSIATHAHRSGARLALVDRDSDGLKVIAREFDHSTQAVECFELDLLDANAIPSRIAAIAERFGGIDGIVCSAGIVRTTPSIGCSLDDWQETIAVNLTGTFLCAQAAARSMSGTRRGGSIVTVSSMRAATGQPNGAAYAASKGGVISLTKSMALDLGVDGIRCNCIAPGIVDTPMARAAVSPDRIASARDWAPLGRIGLPEDIAMVACFLLSDNARWINGQTIHVNGGAYMS